MRAGFSHKAPGRDALSGAAVPVIQETRNQFAAIFCALQTTVYAEMARENRGLSPAITVEVLDFSAIFDHN